LPPLLRGVGGILSSPLSPPIPRARGLREKASSPWSALPPFRGELEGGRPQPPKVEDAPWRTGVQAPKASPPGRPGARHFESAWHLRLYRTPGALAKPSRPTGAMLQAVPRRIEACSPPERQEVAGPLLLPPLLRGVGGILSSPLSPPIPRTRGKHTAEPFPCLLSPRFGGS
jgi:hypothetical protein